MAALSAVCALCWCTFSLDTYAASRPDRIRIEYVVPTNPEHRQLYELLRERRILEQFQQFLSFMRLPRPLLLKTRAATAYPMRGTRSRNIR